ncbi:MAG: response regulator [Chloroflexota bacterium]
MTTNGSPSRSESEEPLRVLVIDDDQALLRMLRLSLASAGVNVVTASDGLIGLERLKEHGFDVILLDLQMPNMDGRAFYREMRNRGYDTNVVIVSAYGAEEAKRELNAAAAMPKPLDPDQLVETVQRVAALSK